MVLIHRLFVLYPVKGFLFYPFEKRKEKNMKRIINTSVALVVVLVLLLAVGCGKEQPTGLWADATYTEDTTLGNGAKSVTVQVSAEETTVTFTIKTDKETLGAALYELELVNDASFFDTLNGIKADWDKDQAYWAFYVGDDYATVGANETVIKGGESYKFVYTAS